MAPDEAAAAAGDLEWWRSKTPGGWRLVGFELRDRALLAPPGGGTAVQADGRLVRALTGDGPGLPWPEGAGRG